MIEWATPQKTHYDRDLERRIATFLACRHVRIANAKIEATDGVVVMRGEVDSPGQRGLCTTLAARVAGVVKVVNCLRVSAELQDNRPGLAGDRDRKVSAGPTSLCPTA